jgi:hypothetical protein
VGFVFAPAIGALISTLHRGSRRGMGELGEILFLAALGAAVFWLYYSVYILGPASILPREWQNPMLHR